LPSPGTAALNPPDFADFAGVAKLCRIVPNLAGS
jgi:hypothetical protein